MNSRSSRACSECKQKRVRCDLELPSCKRCQKTNRVCSGPAPKYGSWIIVSSCTLGRRSDQNPEFLPSNEGVSSERCQGKAASFPGVSGPSQNITSLHLNEDLTEVALNFYIPSLAEHSKVSRVINMPFQRLFERFSLDTPISSPLKYSAESYAMLILGERLRSKAITDRTYVHYGRAIRATQEALQCPEQTSAEELITSVFIMAQIEVIIGKGCAMKKVNTHLKGMTAIMHRYPALVQDLNTQQLFVAISNQMTMAHIRENIPLPKFEIGGARFDSMLNDGLPADRLSFLGSKIPNLRKRTESMFAHRLRVENGHLGLLLRLLDDALSLDFHLQQWMRSLPMDLQRPKIINGANAFPPGSTTSHSYPKSWHLYPDGPSVVMINRYRVFRIYVLAIVARCTNISTGPFNQDMAQYNINAQKSLNGLADDVCSSVQSYLVTTSESGPSPLYKTGSKGYMPISNIRIPDLFHALSVVKLLECMLKNKRQWVADCMQFIIDEFQEFQGIAVKASRPSLITGRSMFGPESYE